MNSSRCLGSDNDYVSNVQCHDMVTLLEMWPWAEWSEILSIRFIIPT